MTNEFLNNISVKKEIEENNRKKQIAENLLCGKIGISELNERETEEMIGFFKEDIQKIDIEIEKTKNRIIKMRKELQEENA